MDTVRIGLLSKLMRMTPEAIRFYEKKNIISPKRKADSKYREYSMTDIKKLYDCKNLRNIQFSIKEVDQIMEEISLEENQAALLAKKNEVERTIQEQRMVLNKIERSLQANTLFEKYQNKYELVTGIDYAFYAYSKNEKLHDELVLSPVYEQVMNCHNLFSCSAVFDLAQNELPEFGFSIGTELALENGISTDDPVRLLKSTHAIYTVIKTAAIIQLEDIEPIIDWAQSKEYAHQTLLLARLISSFYDQGQEERYYEIYLPIVKK